MTLISHAQHELNLLTLRATVESGGESDEIQTAMNRHLLAMVKLFAREGHSGFSASYAIGLLEKLLRFEPLTPLTGGDDEWVALDYGPEMAAQNKRCSHVFKRADGTAYDSEGRIFREPGGACYTDRGSVVDITFPYTPRREYVDDIDRPLPPAPSEDA